MSFENFISEKAIARRANAVVCGREAFSRRKRQEKEKRREEEEEEEKASSRFSCRRRTDARERGEKRKTRTTKSLSGLASWSGPWLGTTRRTTQIASRQVLAPSTALAVY